MDERGKYDSALALLFRALAPIAAVALHVARAWNRARAWRASPRGLVIGFIGAATQRAGLPLPIILAALLPLDVAFRAMRRS